MQQRTFEEVRESLRGKVILVANRGIPARRISRSIRERFEAIAAVTATDIDKAMPAAASAQELILLGADPRAYLDLPKIIRLARERGCVAIHPGWGFASEDNNFPRLCEEAGITFIGASAEAMHQLGNKVEARRVARSLGIPVVPGSDESVDIPQARAIAREIGLPIMLKAEGGGGGRGIFLVQSEEELEDAFEKASAMAEASFGNPRLFVEKYLPRVHHIEIQVIADRWGNVFAFDERDCTVQRNNQKLLEMTPSPWAGMTPVLRERLKNYARKLVTAVGYSSVATVEFLVTDEGTPYMIEVNTRLQVEHGITESRYGVDLVEEMIAIAFGSTLRFTEETVRPSFHALQVRVNLEDPQDSFTPNSGLITRYLSPGGPGVRLDSNLCAGYEFPPNYDSAGSLLITYARDWHKTLGIMNRALGEYMVSGPKTTIPFLRRVINDPLFREGKVTTTFVKEHPELFKYTDLAPEQERLANLVAEISAKGYNPYVSLGVYRSKTTPRLGRFSPVLPELTEATRSEPSPYPQGDREALLSYIRDTGRVHFTDTTTRDMTQSNTGNRMRLAEDRLVGPYLDNAGLFSIENGGGAHFHVAMLANMTYPFSEAEEWNRFAPKTLKQLLVRSTNVLGYSPQPRNLMHLTGEMICEHYDVVRCFDFLNEADNMQPIAEVVLSRADRIFEPAIALSRAPWFDVSYCVKSAEQIVTMVANTMGIPEREATRKFILGLKDMAGVCSPAFMTALVRSLKARWPELVLHYHRHVTDGLFLPACAAAAQAGCEIIDAGLGASVRSYGQGDLLSLAAYLEDELGMKTLINREAISKANFVAKQFMPYFDRYCSPYFQGVDYEVTRYQMPGGATSSSQEGAVKHGYIQLLPFMLEYLECTRRIVRYHDVTPGSQITWNTAFLAVTGAFKKGGMPAVERLLAAIRMAGTKKTDLTDAEKAERLTIYTDCNEAFRNLLLGKFGRLPLGFPEDWVYESAFGPAKWRDAIASRTEVSPLVSLAPAKLEDERAALTKLLKREPTEEEFVIYLNHPADALKTMEFRRKFGDPNALPLDVWFEGLKSGAVLNFNTSDGKPHQLHLLSIDAVNEDGVSTVRYTLDSEILKTDVKLEAGTSKREGVVMADPTNPMEVASPRKADLWIVHVAAGDIVKKGQELFNVSIMKQEKAVLAPCDGIVKRVIKTADFAQTRRMVPVEEGELIVELGPVPRRCPACGSPAGNRKALFCAFCGGKLPEVEEDKKD
ncbi:pyruvate carboxylase [Sutterella sp.]|uniref:pyruvate carboxylase n=1 Tax=Sutterella sp. TaxID=1981025 RepID=UPI0026DF18AE|nr:pyruvate carboxylase [Sutterella sp.]MDO5531542.1 pyruvate carboxylase [Sutterella sp.]